MSQAVGWDKLRSKRGRPYDIGPPYGSCTQNRKTDDGEPAQANESRRRLPPRDSSGRPRRRRHFRVLRGEIPAWQASCWASCCLVVCLGLWWCADRGRSPKTACLGPTVLPSPAETFADFPACGSIAR